jgi:hypothetical protein
VPDRIWLDRAQDFVLPPVPVQAIVSEDDGSVAVRVLQINTRVVKAIETIQHCLSINHQHGPISNHSLFLNLSCEHKPASPSMHRAVLDMRERAAARPYLPWRERAAARPYLPW